MAKPIMMDQLHLTILAPRNLSKPEYMAIRRGLKSPRFSDQLRRAIRAVVRRFPSLAKIKITVTS